MTITYAMTACVLVIGLILILADVSIKLKGSEHRNISILIVCTTIFYVAMDCAWIVVYTADEFNRSLFVVLNFLFYSVYITLPYIWFLFAKHFAQSRVTGRLGNTLFAVPWMFNAALVLITMIGPKLLWVIGGSEDRYTRGPLFGVFTKVDLLYYFISVIGIIVLMITGRGAEMKTLRRVLGFALIPAVGVFIYTYWISVDAIYPFQPCCFFLGIMFAYITLATQAHDDAVAAEAAAKQKELERRLELQQQLVKQEAYGDQQARMISSLTSNYKSVYFIDLDSNNGVCYQEHPDIQNAVKAGEEFPYLETVAAYGREYITEDYLDGFLEFIKPESIRKGLGDEKVIAYRYLVRRNGIETYEMVRFASVYPDKASGRTINEVSACFADVDMETRKTLDQSRTLSEALANAEQANLAKSAFLSNMSHEIRTPMNAIIGLNNLAINDRETSEKTKEYLSKINVSAHHLLNIINDILDMSRIESGRMAVKNEEFSFIDALEHVNTIISGQCTEKGIRYECHLKGDIDDYYISDEVKLRQVMINLLGNAVKFTPTGGQVTFTVEEAARLDNKTTLRFIVEDTGIGMSEEYLPHLFDAFTQEDASTTSKYGSTGLGMPITKSIVEMMNGSIEVESKKGKGSKFTVTVTLSDSERSRQHADEAAEEVHRLAGSHRLSALIVDDDPLSLEHDVAALEQAGISCQTALSGAEAVNLVRLHEGRMEPFDMILVDWRMPEMDGVMTTRAIREAIDHDHTIMIMMSYNWEDVETEAREAGSDCFVRKPLFAATVEEEFVKAAHSRSITGSKVAADLKGRRILVAEDMPVNAEILVMVLSMRDITAEIAENGRIAVDMFSAHDPGYYDAILMDMRMPEMDGLEATKKIRELDRKDAASIPIIALTANAFDEDVQRSMQAGLNAHLSKPVEPDSLFRTLESLIR